MGNPPTSSVNESANDLFDRWMAHRQQESGNAGGDAAPTVVDAEPTTPPDPDEVDEVDGVDEGGPTTVHEAVVAESTLPQPDVDTAPPEPADTEPASASKPDQADASPEAVDTETTTPEAADTETTTPRTPTRPTKPSRPTKTASTPPPKPRTRKPRPLRDPDQADEPLAANEGGAAATPGAADTEPTTPRTPTRPTKPSRPTKTASTPPPKPRTRKPRPTQKADQTVPANEDIVNTATAEAADTEPAPSPEIDLVDKTVPANETDADAAPDAADADAEPTIRREPDQADKTVAVDQDEVDAAPDAVDTEPTSTPGVDTESAIEPLADPVIEPGPEPLLDPPPLTQATGTDAEEVIETIEEFEEFAHPVPPLGAASDAPSLSVELETSDEEVPPPAPAVTPMTTDALLPPPAARPTPGGLPAAVPTPGVVLFSPHRGGRHLLTIAAALLAAAVGIAGYVAWQVQTPVSFAIAGGLVALLFLAWKLRGRITGTQVTIENGMLRIAQGTSRHLFPLATPHPPIEILGEPGQRSWKVLIHRRGMSPFVITRKMVDPAEFTEVVRRFRPQA